MFGKFLTFSGAFLAGALLFAAVPESNSGSGVYGGVKVINNEYFTDSVRYSNLAKIAFDDGDYDASLKYSMESIRIARQSDEFVTIKLKIAESVKKMAEAQNLLAFASNNKLASYYPKEYNKAKVLYSAALSARDKEQWDVVLNNAMSVIETLAALNGAPAQSITVKSVKTTSVAPAAKTAQNASASGAVPEKDGESDVLPAQYRVRPWDVSGDCFWNISGRSYIYNNPYLWRVLYNKNKSKLEDPDNPNLIEPGTVLDIPSIRGEKREGMWDAGRKYTPLGK